jgi:hypothetical protein
MSVRVTLVLLHSARCPQLVPELTILAVLRHAIMATSPDVIVSFIDKTNVRVVAALAETPVPVDARRVSLGKWQGARLRSSHLIRQSHNGSNRMQN